MTNPVSQSAYSLDYVAEYLSMLPETLKGKMLNYPHCFPPYVFLGRTKQQDGVIVFPRRLFEQWLEDNAVFTQLSSSEGDGFAKHT